ncbi:PREDICTED: cornulin [Condylura cristata]|uniref:cornulin n=1 Tax=Condylura cristata TaxID=143302 RepID=UPI00033474E9|nr:PREDICTED: cornulin [Condylura cristata]
MPQLLRNINGIIEAFERYARTEGDCKVLTRGELKRLLEQEFADVIVKPHDPATVDEVLRLLDEDNTGTVEFKEFLVLVFKVAQACFKTLSESPGGACGPQEPGSHTPGVSKELEGQRSGSEVGRTGGGQQQEGSSRGPREQASGGQAGLATRTQGQDFSSTQGSGRHRQAESQRQEGGHVEQTQRVGGAKSHQARGRASEGQVQTRGLEGESVTATGTQTQTGTTQTVEQDRSQQGGSTTGHAGTREQGQTQTQSGHSQRWTQVTNYEAGKPVQGGQVQTDPNTLTGGQDGSSTQPEGSMAGGQGQSWSTEVHREWVDDHSRETVFPTPQDQGGANTLTGGQDGSSTQPEGSVAGGQGQSWSTEVHREWVDDHSRETVFPTPQDQGGANTLTGGQDGSSTQPEGSVARGQGQSWSTEVHCEWVDDHLKNTVSPPQDQGGL